MRRVLVMLAALAMMSLALAIEAPVRFDMGPQGSPVKEGYRGITEATVYSPEVGYGWTKAEARSFNAKGFIYKHFGTLYPLESRTEPADALLIDGVADGSDMEFQVDLPNGKYWVFAYLGDVSHSRYKLAVSCNGELVSNHADAFTYRDRGSQGSDVGAVFRLRFAAEVKDGKLTVRFHAAEGRMPSDNVYADYGGVKERSGGGGRGGPGGGGIPPAEAEPFTENSVLGLEVYPFKALPLVKVGDKLEAQGTLGAAISEALLKFNEGDYEGAKEQATALAQGLTAAAPGQGTGGMGQLSGEDRLALAELLLGVAGRPEIYEELPLLEKANAILSDYLRHSPDDAAARHLKMSEYLIETAILLRQQQYGKVGVKMRSIDAVWVAEALLRQIPESEPLYLKSMIYIARFSCGADPLGSTPAASYRGYKTWFALKERFPNNKYVQIYLRGVNTIADRDVYRRLNDVASREEEKKLFEQQLSQHPPRLYDWGYEGAPEWACALRDGLGWVTDIIEWWVTNHQLPDGGINAYGWSDDVEMLRLWSKLAAIGHSDVITLGVTKVAEGAWNADMMNRQWGIEDGHADVEHITEMVADTLPHMIFLDYGNPAYVERSMTTVRSIRDFFTMKNPQGWRLFRSVNVGPNWIDPNAGEAVDSLYAHRLGQIGLGLMWYSENPEAVKTFSEWADSWVEASKSAERGKPAGYLPLGIAFESGKPGYPDTDKWYEAPYNEPPTRINGFIRQNLVYNLLQSAYRVTGNTRYLEPIDVAYSIALDYIRSPVASPEMGSRAWVGKELATGGDFISVLAKNRLYTGSDKYNEFLAQYAGNPKIFFDRLIYFGETPYLRYRVTGDKNWITSGLDAIGHLANKRGLEIVTTEVLMTDRAALGWACESDVFGPFTGGQAGWGDMGMPNMAVSWENLGRHVAILVKESSKEGLKLLAYNFGPKERAVGMELWYLAPGCEYLLTQGPDKDGNDEPDEVLKQESFRLKERGAARYVTLPVGEVQVVTLKRSGGTATGSQAADVGLSSDDITYDGTRLQITLHNIGNAPAKNVHVMVYDGAPAGGKVIADQVIEELKAPTDLVAKTTSLVVPWEAGNQKHLVSVVLDPEEEITEITERNNVATRPVPYEIPEWKRPKVRGEGIAMRAPEGG